MNALTVKVLKIAINSIRWLFGVFFVLGALITFSEHPLANTFLIIGGLLMIPPITDWVVKQTRNKVKSNVIASVAFLASIMALGSSPAPNQPTTAKTDAKESIIATPSSPSSSHVQKVIPAPVVVSNAIAPKNSPSLSDQATNEVKSANADITCKVVGVSDGDTLTCLTNDKNQIKVRLNQIDAPEKAQAFGTASKKALSDLVFGKTVGLKTNGTDKYGRTIAEVFIGDKNINKAMVADGYAWAYREYMTDSQYADLEASARSGTKGLWSEPDPIYPSDFRRGKRGEQTSPVQTQAITQQVEQKAVADSGGSCGSKRYCNQMATCSEARHYLNDCGVSRLDRDGDGVPCESLCN